ncbi:MAG: PfkB family carbohydrate kinase [Pseudolabrys sp.]
MTERRTAPARATVLCAGIAVQDIVMQVAAFPGPGQKVYASDLVTIGGGCAANAAVAAARLGGRVRFAGPLGDPADPASRDIVRGLRDEGIDTGGVRRVRGAQASVSLILIDQDGEKLIATRRGKDLDKARPSDPARLARGANVVLADNRFPKFVLPICRAARARKIPVVIDFDARSALNDPLLALGTHVIASSEALRASTGQRDLRKGLMRLGRSLKGFVAVTDGPNGAYWLDGAVVCHTPAFGIKAVDTLGAGDAFHGGFALAVAEGRPAAEAMRFASATAALKCTRFGGMAAAPTRAQVERLLRMKR